MNFFDSIKRGFAMSAIAYQFTMNHKRVLLFTILSTCIVAFTTIAFFGAFIIKTGIAEGLRGSLLHQHVVTVVHHHVAPRSFIGLLILMIIAIFLHTFIKVGLANYVDDILHNKPTGFFSSMGTAFSRAFLIIKWIIVNWIVGTLIRSLRGKGGSVLSGIIAGLMSLGWGILTFFVIPIMATQNLGIIKTIELSGQSMKKTFGQNVTATLTIRGIQSWLFLLVALPIWAIAFLIWESFSQNILMADTSGTMLTVFGLTAFILPIIIVGPIGLATNIIFRAASYSYAQGKSTGPFSAQMIKDSFVNKAF